MASIRLEMNLHADPWNVWDAVRDVGAIHTRLAPDFVTDVTMDGDARIVTFANGMTAKELIVDVDDAARRLVWIADLLPHELAKPIGGMMQQGMDAMKKKLESA